MNNSRQELLLSVLEEGTKGVTGTDALPPAADLPRSALTGCRVSKNRVINTLNYLCFSDRAVFVNFRHPRFPNGTVSLKAVARSCLENHFECVWQDRSRVPERLADYEFMHVYIDDGRGLIVLRPGVEHIDARSMRMDLTEVRCCEILCRSQQRFEAAGIDAEFVQSGLLFAGRLVDFSAMSCRVILREGHGSFKHINRQATGVLLLRDEHGIIFSGDCRILRESVERTQGEFVFELVQTSIPRFPSKSERSTRIRLIPSPQIMFEHPLTRTTQILGVEDIAGSGFSVLEVADRALLMPGLMLPKVALSFATGFIIQCRAQIVYRRCETDERGEAIARCGVAFVGMGSKDQAVLSSILHHGANDEMHVCSTVDTEALWRFFFESGFVYPEKSAAIMLQKERFKETCRKLYVESPEIARHFVYLHRGEIMGHISMVRFYEDTWLFHHHAARGQFVRKAGLVVLSHIARYVNDFYNLPETRLDYVLCYFQPKNRFPMRVFGAFTERVGDLKRCSMDSFMVLTVPRRSERFRPGDDYLLNRATAADLAELQTYYEQASGGLTLRALDLSPDTPGESDVSRVYERHGLLRVRRLFSLRRQGELKAVLMVCLSDVGLNMSNLTNCIHAFVLDPLGLSLEQFLDAIAPATSYFRQEAVTVLLYPPHCGEAWGMQADKIYNLWVMDTRCTVLFHVHMDALVNRRVTG